MKISELLNENLIIADLKAGAKQQALEEMVACLTANRHGIDAKDLFNVLIEREKLGSTGIGNGIAIPHGKLDGLDNICLVFARSTAGIEFDSLDGKPVHLIFLLVAPSNSAGVHLKALARLSRLLKEKNFRDDLLGAADAAAMYTIVVVEDEKITA
jgi:PTS system nitrogen regulatory IIA component